MTGLKRDLLLLILVQWNTCISLRILVLMPTYGRSHYFVHKALVENLAHRGHSVTFVAPFEEPNPIANLEYITLDIGKFLERGEQASFQQLADIHRGSGMDGLFYKTFSIFAFKLFSNVSCNYFLNSPKLHKFRAQAKGYDLVIAEAFTTDCFLPWALHFDAPLILFSPSVPLPWHQNILGQPANPSYVPNCKSGFVTPMTFWERMQNMMINTFHLIYYHYIQEPVNYELSKTFFGKETPQLWTIARNASILLANSHFSLVGADVNIPGIIEIGGIHIDKVKILPHVSYTNNAIRLDKNSNGAVLHSV